MSCSHLTTRLLRSPAEALLASAPGSSLYLCLTLMTLSLDLTHSCHMASALQLTLSLDLSVLESVHFVSSVAPAPVCLYLAASWLGWLYSQTLDPCFQKLAVPPAPAQHADFDAPQKRVIRFLHLVSQPEHMPPSRSRPSPLFALLSLPSWRMDIQAGALTPV